MRKPALVLTCPRCGLAFESQCAGKAGKPRTLIACPQCTWVGKAADCNAGADTPAHKEG